LLIGVVVDVHGCHWLMQCNDDYTVYKTTHNLKKTFNEKVNLRYINQLIVNS